MKNKKDDVRQQIRVLYLQYFDCLEKATMSDKSASREEGALKNLNYHDAQQLKDKAEYIQKEISKLQESIDEWLQPNEYLALHLSPTPLVHISNKDIKVKKS